MRMIFSPNFIIIVLIKNRRDWIFKNIFFFSCLRTILIFWYQSKKFGLVNLLASSMLYKNIFILLMVIYQPINIKDNEYWFHA